MKVYEVKRNGGCWYGCSTDFCTGCDFDYEDGPIYLTKDLAKKALREIAEKEKFEVYEDMDGGLCAEKHSTKCALNGSTEENTTTEENPNERLYPTFEEITIEERELIEQLE